MGVGDFVGGDQRRTHRAESVEGLADGPLAGAHLVVPCADVVEGQIARHVIQRVCRCHIARRAPDDKGKLGLVVHLLGDSGQDNRRARPDNCIVVFGEDRRVVGDGLVGFRRVVPVVEADAQNLAGPGQGRL